MARKDNVDSEPIQKLAKAMTSPEVKKFFEDNYSEIARRLLNKARILWFAITVFRGFRGRLFLSAAKYGILFMDLRGAPYIPIRIGLRIYEKEVIDRLITYAQVDTQSDENSNTCPSTPGQLTLGQLLVDELKESGMQDVTMDENGYVMATLPANSDKPIPTIGFLAHIDTATDFTGAGVKPQIVEQYDGQDIILNRAQNVVLSRGIFRS